jgi:threonine dehydrogenase-like Zn-dependent dehydrogenase
LSVANSVDSSSAALVIGAGGMARATVYALMDLGVRNIVIWNRSIARAELLVANYSVYATSLATPGNFWQTRFRILHNLTDPWPADMNQPTIIVCTPPAHTIDKTPGLDFTVPEPWFGSMTGGVIVEVSLRIICGYDHMLTNRVSYPTKRRQRLFCGKRTATHTGAGQSSSPLSF